MDENVPGTGPESARIVWWLRFFARCDANHFRRLLRLAQSLYSKGFPYAVFGRPADFFSKASVKERTMYALGVQDAVRFLIVEAASHEGVSEVDMAGASEWMHDVEKRICDRATAIGGLSPVTDDG